MKTTVVCIFIFISFVLSAQPDKTIYKKIGGITVYNIESKKVFMVRCGLMVDADGSPKAYHKNDKMALDYLTNAGKPGNWWALVTDTKKQTGNPVIQTASDPAPGYYISMTSLEDFSKKMEDPKRYVNSATVPYVVIPAGFSKNFKRGDIALVLNKRNNKRSFAIFADTGPGNKIGEGSIYLAKQLGIESSPKDGGVSSGIIYILIKNSGTGKPLGIDEINRIGNSRLTEEDIAAIIQ